MKPSKQARANKIRASHRTYLFLLGNLFATNFIIMVLLSAWQHLAHLWLALVLGVSAGCFWMTVVYARTNIVHKTYTDQRAIAGGITLAVFATMGSLWFLVEVLKTVL